MKRAALRLALRDAVAAGSPDTVRRPPPFRRAVGRWRSRPGLDVAVGMSVVLALTSILALIGQPIGDGRLLRLLVALAAICLAVLAHHRAPSVAWLAAIAAAGASATLWFDRARPFAAASAEGIPWAVLATVASVWAIATAAIAARYATRPGERLDPVAVPLALGAVGWLVVGCLTTVGVVLAGQREPDPAFTWIDVATVPISVFLPLLVVLIGIGAAADVRSARHRAAERMPARRASDDDNGRWLWQLAILTARELVPGQAVADEVAHDAERTRLAGDLHAVVVPGLRRAIAEAESGRDLDALSRQLRAVDRELERLMADRWPVVLEAFGIVRALEDLAERLESDGAPPISIDVVRGADAARQPPAVERAAWRFAEIALDNAVRHGDPRSINVSVDSEVQALRLSVVDDGRGMPVGTRVEGHSGRGLIDAGRRAAEVGATVTTQSDAGSGTAITFEWRAPGGG